MFEKPKSEIEKNTDAVDCLGEGVARLVKVIQNQNARISEIEFERGATVNITLPAVDRVEVIHPKPGDILIAHVPEPVTRESVEALTQVVQDAMFSLGLPDTDGVVGLVLTGDVTIRVGDTSDVPEEKPVAV